MGFGKERRSEDKSSVREKVANEEKAGWNKNLNCNGGGRGKYRRPRVHREQSQLIIETGREKIDCLSALTTGSKAQTNFPEAILSRDFSTNCSEQFPEQLSEQFLGNWHSWPEPTFRQATNLLWIALGIPMT